MGFFFGWDTRPHKRLSPTSHNDKPRVCTMSIPPSCPPLCLFLDWVNVIFFDRSTSGVTGFRPTQTHHPSSAARCRRWTTRTRFVPDVENPETDSDRLRRTTSLTNRVRLPSLAGTVMTDLVSRVS